MWVASPKDRFYLRIPWQYYYTSTQCLSKTRYSYYSVKTL